MDFYYTLSTAFICGMVVGAWSTRRDIVQKCRKLGGFYVGSTTIKVSEIKEPEYVPPIGLGQVPPRRPPPKPAEPLAKLSNE